MMVVGPPQKLADRFCKPPAGALFRKDGVLSEQGKGEEYSSGKKQRVEHVNCLNKASVPGDTLSKLESSEVSKNKA